jgi:hypothetical protein
MTGARTVRLSVPLCHRPYTLWGEPLGTFRSWGYNTQLFGSWTSLFESEWQRILYAIDTLQKTPTVVILKESLVGPRRNTSNVSVFAKPWIRQCRLLIYLEVHFSFFRIYPDCLFGQFSRLYECQIGYKSMEQSLKNLRKFSRIFLEVINKKVKNCFVSSLF